jgi:hypothetical protein
MRAPAYLLLRATLDGCKLTGSMFVDCTLRPLTVSGGQWRGVTMRGARLTELRLPGVVLSDSDLSEADLSDADLSDTDLTGAVLRRTKLHRTDLRRARLDGVDLSTALLGRPASTWLAPCSSPSRWARSSTQAESAGFRVEDATSRRGSVSRMRRLGVR